MFFHHQSERKPDSLPHRVLVQVRLPQYAKFKNLTPLHFPLTPNDDPTTNLITEITNFSVRDSDFHYEVKTTLNPKRHWINTSTNGTGYVDIECQLKFLQGNWRKVCQDPRVKAFVEKSYVIPKPKYKIGTLVYFGDNCELFEVSGMLTFENLIPVSLSSSISSKDLLAMC